MYCSMCEVGEEMSKLVSQTKETLQHSDIRRSWKIVERGKFGWVWPDPIVANDKSGKLDGTAHFKLIQ